MKRYIVRQGGPTYTSQGSYWWLVIDTERQDAIMMRTSDRAAAETFAEQLNVVAGMLS